MTLEEIQRRINKLMDAAFAIFPTQRMVLLVELPKGDNELDRWAVLKTPEGLDHTKIFEAILVMDKVILNGRHTSEISH